MSRLPVIVVAVLLATLTACSSPDAPDGAAEPAEGPSTSTPVGAVVEIGALPQGAVYDATSGVLAVAVREPNRLLLIDGTTGQTRNTVALPGHARHLQVDAVRGTVLVGAEDADELVEVGIGDGVVRSTPVGDYPHDATALPDGLLVVGDEFAGTVSVVQDGDVVRTIEGFDQPGGVIAVDDLVVVVDVGSFDVTTVDVHTGRRLDSVAAGDGPTHAVPIGDGRFAVVDTRGDEVLVFDADPLQLQGTLALEGSPYGVAADPQSGTLWVTLTGRNEVVGLDVREQEPREIARYATVVQPDTVAVRPGSSTVWVTGRRDGQLQRIDR